MMSMRSLADFNQNSRAVRWLGGTATVTTRDPKTGTTREGWGLQLHDVALLEKYERSAAWSPGKDLRGAVAQIQKTLHKVNLKVNQNLQRTTYKEGNPNGESIAFIKPRGLVFRCFGNDLGSHCN
jgi:hypothetical protein